MQLLNTLKVAFECLGIAIQTDHSLQSVYNLKVKTTKYQYDYYLQLTVFQTRINKSHITMFA